MLTQSPDEKSIEVLHTPILLILNTQPQASS